MDIKYPVVTKRNAIYRGPSESKKFSDFFEEVQEDLTDFMSNINELNGLIQTLSSDNLGPDASGFLHPSGYLLPDPSGYIKANSRGLTSMEDSFKIHLLNEFST